jgi:hypothetical protein
MKSLQAFLSHFAAAPTNGDPAESIELGKLVAEIHKDVLAKSPSQYEIRPNKSEKFNALKKQPHLQAKVARFLFEDRHHIMFSSKMTNYWDKERIPGFAIFNSLARTNLQIAPTELLSWVQGLKAEQKPKTSRNPFGLEDWPIGYLIQQVERKAKKNPLSEKELKQLREISVWPEMLAEKESYIYGTDFAKVAARINAILQAHDGTEPKAVLYKKLSGDTFGTAVETRLNALPEDEASKWHRVFNHAATASAGKPTKRFTAAADTLKDACGKEWSRKQLQAWLGDALAAKTAEVEHTQTWGRDSYTYVETTLFTKSNATLLKGLVWIADGFRDVKTVNLIADLCEKSMRKIPGQGPAAQSVANACLRYLEITPGAEATARLARLATAIKQKSVQKKVAEIVAQKAEAAGITTIQLEERVVPCFGLTKGEKTVVFDDYKLHIQVNGPGRVTQTWVKPDGTPQKTKPSFIAEKAAHKAKFDKAKAEVVNLKKILTSQRDRIDRLFAEDLEWSLEEIEQYYTGHDLVCTIAANLIWSLETKGKAIPALCRDGAWQDVTGEPVATDETTTVRLWHPVEHSTDEIMQWRARITELEILQPSKQAYREIYLLTDAERKTDIYSNRMAAHMLKQHQMSTLMAARGWRYQLMGAYDDGLDDQWAHKAFVTSDLVAEYLIHTNWDENNYNDAGIYLYVGTDQLRFTRAGTSAKLDAVPARLLSETMREADLFVGVGSVGNDPAWHDQGPTPESRNYWQNYSFGVLDNFAETRKQVLQTLLPRLKIRDKAHIEGKFLIVDGKLNTYKIHLGSSNILMAPGDRYLCIVPGAVSKSAAVALPFDGDNRLSVILSKALMLADDDKITARDIVSQLKR